MRKIRCIKKVVSEVAGISHPYHNIGRIEGGTNTNVVPGKVMFKLDLRMIPEENPADVESGIRAVIADAAALCPGIRVEIKRLLPGRARCLSLTPNVPTNDWHLRTWAARPRSLPARSGIYYQLDSYLRNTGVG